MTYLEIKDNVRASVVCKSWYEAAVSVRVIDQSPWLMCFPQTKNTYEFYDPSNGKKYARELPKSLVGSIVRYSKDGWVLMSKEDSSDFVLFNPFSIDLVVLPDLQLWNYYQLVGFSCAPISSQCVVFTIKDYDPGHVTIRTWSPGQTMWTSMQVESQFLDVENNKVVFSNGLFYCLNRTNCLAVFDPSLRTWNVLDVLPPRCPDEESWNGVRFMVGYKGDIFVICTYENKDPLVFQLDLARGTWEKNDTLGSLTIFVSSMSCESRTYVNKGMLRNSVYFPKLSHGEKRCVAYSVHERRYHPREHNLDWGNQLSSNDFWIEPPKNVFELI
ncbi:PREDICTED: F-box/kelch-repeat protein At1g57790 [Camelina sativa]|uniref:F-box/kelch-repeat protein At1g57790 n=1 Tax=Camelina sativa TaxID=90675 RepID=A0ABM0Z743_CAMSA|nr:PREDICTED: F-box/kelch-repeat protein At1g57790 [Camelina sativa]